MLWILNSSKMPFGSKLGLIDRASLLSDLAMPPFIILGDCWGFTWCTGFRRSLCNLMVKALASVAAILLCIKPWLSGGGG